MDSTLELVLGLLLVFQIKHFVADYLLQNAYMLGKFKKQGWFGPLLAHTSMHGVVTLIIALVYGLEPHQALFLGALDMVIHSVIDKIKADFSARYDKNKDKQFWWWLGGDQMAHHLTHYLIILIISTEVLIG